ncbi:MAG: hypothetical protein WB341_01855 [Terracidiphilus sp.]
MKRVFVTVSGGCAEFLNDTLPPGYVGEVIDFDNIQEGDAFPSDEAQAYCLRNGLYDPPNAGK